MFIVPIPLAERNLINLHFSLALSIFIGILDDDTQWETLEFVIECYEIKLFVLIEFSYKLLSDEIRLFCQFMACEPFNQECQKRQSSL